MSEVINLRQARKSRTRTQKEKSATANRILHGQTKAEKKRHEREAERAKRLLDGVKLTPDPET